MKPRFIVLLLGLALGGVALGTPLYAQTGHVAIGGWFGVGQQYQQPYPYPQQPQGPRPYPGRPGSGRGGGHGIDEYALNTGFRDGYEKGFDDAADRDRFDPRRERWYREGDRGYRRDFYVSREQYRNVYRRGFLEGYEAGYRDGRRGGYGGYGNGQRTPWGWR